MVKHFQQETAHLSVAPIGVVHSCFPEKFGVPRQPGMVKSAPADLELLKPYNREEMVRGIEQFSHVWLIFQFHDTVSEGWKPTVRPPWLGGQKRVGVFASRSPHRPNHLGLSVVKLEGVTIQPGIATLHLSGVDLLDGTPVYDIKPYVPYSDIVSDASCGYADGYTPDRKVVFLPEVSRFCDKYRQKSGRDIATLITELLVHDPRPASQKKNRIEFGMQLWDVNVRWKVEEAEFVVCRCSYVGDMQESWKKNDE